MTSADGAARGHLGNLLSALVDRELGQGEREAAERHLAICPACRAEWDVTSRMQSLVAALPLVDLPADVLARAVGGVRRPPANLWVGVAAALLGLTVLSASPSPHRVTPQQVRTIALTSIPVVTGTVAAQPRPPALTAPFRAPARLAGGYLLVSVLHRNGVVQVNYSDGLHRLAVFEQSGALDASHLPQFRQAVELGSVRGVSYAWMDGELVTWQLGGATYTVMGDGPPDDLLTAAESMPPGRSLAVVQRVRLASRGLLEKLAGKR